METAATRTQATILPRLGPDEHVPVPGSLTFDEVIQALNPLHHLPGVGSLYRAVTGEALNPALRVLGGAAFGGPIGMISAAVFAAIEQFTSPTASPAATASSRPAGSPAPAA